MPASFSPAPNSMASLSIEEGRPPDRTPPPWTQPQPLSLLLCRQRRSQNV